MKIPLKYHKNMSAKLTIWNNGTYITGYCGKDDYRPVRIDLKNNSIEYIEKVI